ncbi:hypothetical protein UM594_04190 [Staphylococcus aureus]|nr:hypothetical protein UM594_04190 [Staphylococcus aureus]
MEQTRRCKRVYPIKLHSYEGNDSFLAGPTEATSKLLGTSNAVIERRT